MEKPNRIPVIYGYLVCLVSIIVALIALPMIINAAFNLSNPLQVNDMTGYQSYTLSSFEGYKTDVLNGHAALTPVSGSSAAAPAYVPTDAQLRTAYDAAKNDKIDSVTLQAHGSIADGVVMLLLAAILFWTHWRWLEKKGRAA